MNTKNLILFGMIVLFTACGSRSGNDLNIVEVREVIEVEKYTYLLVKNRKDEFWIAAPAMVANPGEKYSYQGGMEMTDFYSKDLDRTFDKVLFVETLFREDASGMMDAGHGNAVMGHGGAAMGEETTPGSRAGTEKADVVLKKVEGTVSIAEIYADPEHYKGQAIRVSGQVTKFNPAIMGRNWVHLQDGTEHDGDFDLTVTSSESFEVGTAVILEGILAIDMDFGYGYAYEVLLEKAKGIK